MKIQKILMLILVQMGIFQASSYANSEIEYQRFQTDQGIDIDVFKISDLSQLQLFFYDVQNGKPLRKLTNIKTQLNPCEHLVFAMNAGMYHPDDTAVGLYIENKQQKSPLNLQNGVGNFFLQPNGVLAWNSHHAIIQTALSYKTSSFKADYATQSGPMLVINGQINSKFDANSVSNKIRNGVGVKNNTLYFAITNSQINFYQFAAFFKNQLAIDNALYLDGTISSVYFPDIQREDHFHRLGPMVAFINSQVCR